MEITDVRTISVSMFDRAENSIRENLAVESIANDGDRARRDAPGIESKETRTCSLSTR